MLLFLRCGTTCEARAELLALLCSLSRSVSAITLTQIGAREVIACDHAALAEPVPDVLREHPAVERLFTFPTSYQLVHRDASGERSRIVVGDARFCSPVAIGGEHPIIIAGPSAVENKEHLFSIARAVRAAGAHILRGDVFTPRTSPYRFQGLGIEGLQMLAEARELTGLPIMTEVIEPDQVEMVARYADILHIGSHHMQNVPLLRAVGRHPLRRPVLLKRSLAATMEEWLLAAETIVAAGNPNVILCEGGTRGYDPEIGTILDLCCVPRLRSLTHLPLMVDPSQGTGRSALVPAMARASIAVGADGLLIETHDAPLRAFCGGGQALTPDQLRVLVYETRLLSPLLAVKGGPVRYVPR